MLRPIVALLSSGALLRTVRKLAAGATTFLLAVLLLSQVQNVSLSSRTG